ncbi:hypothetical protein BDV96DRAFT_604128 [Lophiotrema nucula]|uniref:BTB domain-containing protein n=1 Tax=Lophiotrema nucula TaxID=690887 RepID=A0A6A5YSB0_9PLEO|nr:hypothetical protein BDV96DRAFT_604128 [Lophiotrema nucula]
MIRSGQFTFLVGEEKKWVVVHAGAIAANTEPLNKLVNGCAGGRTSESETRTAEFKDIKYEDFVRICEYAYYGDYSVSSLPREAVAEPAAPGGLYAEYESPTIFDNMYGVPNRHSTGDGDWGLSVTFKNVRTTKTMSWEYHPVLAVHQAKSALRYKFDNLDFLIGKYNSANFSDRFLSLSPPMPPTKTSPKYSSLMLVSIASLACISSSRSST